MKVDKSIYVFDNFVSKAKQTFYYDYIIKSYFKIGWEDLEEFDKRGYPCLHSSYTRQNVDQLELIPNLKKYAKKTPFKNIINENNYIKCMVNLSKPADPNFTHCHPKQVVCLYYANLNWHPNFAGETLFYTEDQKEIRYGSSYTPNRLVIFDGEIPHTIRAQNITGPNYRFSISLFFNK